MTPKQSAEVIMVKKLTQHVADARFWSIMVWLIIIPGVIYLLMDWEPDPLVHWPCFIAAAVVCRIYALKWARAYMDKLPEMRDELRRRIESE